MRISPAGIACIILLSFGAGIFAHVLYRRWNPAAEPDMTSPAATYGAPDLSPIEPRPHRVIFRPISPLPPQDAASDLPVLEARNVEKIRAMTGREAKIRGRVFRVGHSPKSNTYFINFGPSREALTAVIFASAAELFEKAKISPQKFENREVEIHGWVKDHPQYGLEVIIERPGQIRLLD